MEHAQVSAAQIKGVNGQRRGATADVESSKKAQRQDPELLRELETAAEAGRHAILTKHIQGVARLVLGFAAGQEIDSRRPLNELGLDSLMAVEFRNILAAALQRPLPATMLFSYPAIEDITRYIAAELFSPLENARPAENGNLLDRIEDLSDAEVDALLAGRIGGIE